MSSSLFLEEGYSVKKRRMASVACAALLCALVGLISPLSRAQELPLPSPSKGEDTGSVSGQETSGYFGIKSGAKYDVSFKQASLREVIQFLAWIADLNVMMPPNLEGVVDLSFRQVTVEAALNAVIRSNKLEWAVEAGVVRIGDVAQFKEYGEDLKTDTFMLGYAPAAEMAEKVKTLLSDRGSVIFDSRTNSITIREVPANIDKVARFIEDVDIKDAQVLIESKILEATRRFTQSLGIQWGINRGADGSTFRLGGLNAVGTSDSGRTLNVNTESTTIPPNSGLLIGALFNAINLDVQLLAAERRGDIYVISDPSIVTSNGQAANIRSGATLLLQNLGSVTVGGTTQTGGNIEEKKTGIELTVTPQITVNNYVKLNIEATTSTPDFSQQVQGIPVILDNTAKTMVLVKDGETTVIGGLSRYSDAMARQNVPYLSRIPLLGNLFKGRDRLSENTELMVFIRPTIIRVEGMEPAQVRIHEVEQRREAMNIKPILKPEADKIKDDAMKEPSKSLTPARGNKYSK